MFPGATPSFTTPTAGETLAAGGHTALHIAEEANIVALANKIGTGASTPTSGLLLRGNGVGTSAWSQVILTLDVSGVLPQANGGTGTTLATGTGKAVYDTSPAISSPTITGGTISSPTITTPTIASFINSIHNHENNAGGGTLNAANALQAGSVNFNNLLSSIFSSQVQSQANAGTAGGTIWWVNLGGIKIMWGQTGTLNMSSEGSHVYTVTFPAFFTTVQSTVMSTSGQAVGTVLQATIGNGNPTTSGLNFYLFDTAGSVTTASTNVGYIIIGT